MYLVIKILLFLLVITGFILSWKLFSVPKKARYLAFYILAISLIALNQILSFYNSTIDIFPIFNTFTGYFLTPLIFFHGISLFKITNLKKLVYKHFIISVPFLCIIIYWIFDDYRRKLLGYNNNSYITILLVVQCFVYTLLLIFFLNQRNKIIQGIKPTLQYKRIRFSITLFLIQAIITATILFENFTSYDSLSEYLVLFIFSLFMVQVLLIFFLQEKYPTFFKENDKLFHFSNKGTDVVEIYKSQSGRPVLEELQKLMSEQKNI